MFGDDQYEDDYSETFPNRRSDRRFVIVSIWILCITKTPHLTPQEFQAEHN